MKLSTISRMGLLAFLFGCDTKSPYQKKDGSWRYKDQAMGVAASENLTPLSKNFAKTARAAYFRTDEIPGADGASFEALSDHYAKDKSHAYYCDDFRKSQEYWLVKRNRVRELPGVDAPTFRYLNYNYARDTSHFFHEGVQFPVADAATFELLSYNHQRDQVSGYFAHFAIAGSDGKTFATVDDSYSKDAKHVYYSTFDSDNGKNPGGVRTVTLKGADPATFAPLESGYARDAGQIYYQDRIIADGSSPLAPVGMTYMKTATLVFYLGDTVKGADATTFKVLDPFTAEVDATDATSSFKNGVKVKPKR